MPRAAKKEKRCAVLKHFFGWWVLERRFFMKKQPKNVRLVKVLLATSLCILIMLAVGIQAAFAKEEESGKQLQNYLVFRAGPGWANEIQQNAGSRAGAAYQPTSEYGVHFAYGHRFLNWLRLEFELGYIDLEINEMILRGRGSQTIYGTNSYTQFNGMLNAYAEWNNETSFTPFIGGGFGLSRTKLDVTFIHPGTGLWVSTKNTDYPLAYQFLAGVAWAFHPAWELELLYKYYGTNDITRSNPTGTFQEHEVEGIRSSFIQLGIRYNF